MIDPFGLSKPHVALVGMASTSRHLAPYDDPEAEIWSINESYHPKNHAPKSTWKDKRVPEPYLKRWDRWFQLHPRWDYMRLGNFNHENHPHWLTAQKGPCLLCGGKGKIPFPGKEPKLCKECDGTGEYDPAIHRRTLDFPIYLQDPDPDVPGSFVYPFEEIGAAYGISADHVRYHTNSMTLMLAFAMHIGLERRDWSRDGRTFTPPRGQRLRKVSVWGFEMSSETEYGQQKPSAEFWLGILIGRALHEDIELELPEGCHLLGGTVPLYAFDKTPGLTAMHAEIRVNALQQAFAKAQAELQQIQGAKQLLVLQMQNTKGQSKAGHDRLQAELANIQRREFDKICELNSVNGALQEAKHTKDEIKNDKSAETLTFVTAAGKQSKLDLLDYQRQAAKDLQEGPADEDTVDGVE